MVPRLPQAQCWTRSEGTARAGSVTPVLADKTLRQGSLEGRGGPQAKTHGLQSGNWLVPGASISAYNETLTISFCNLLWLNSLALKSYHVPLFVPTAVPPTRTIPSTLSFEAGGASFPLQVTCRLVPCVTFPVMWCSLASAPQWWAWPVWC